MPWSDLARTHACTEIVYRVGSFEFLTLLASRCRCGRRWNEIIRHFPNHLISVYLLPFEDPRKYFTYIIHFSPHSNPWREVSLSPNTLMRQLRVPEVWQSCLTSLKLNEEPGLEPRVVRLQETQFRNCLRSPSFWACLSTRSMLSLKYFGGGDMAIVIFSGYGSRSPLKHDFDGSLLVCLLKKVIKMSFIHVKSETEARYDGVSSLYWLPPSSPLLLFSSSVTHRLHAAVFIDLLTTDDKWLLRNRVPVGERSPEPSPTLFALWNSRLFNLLYLILRTPDSTFLNDFPLFECLHSYLWRRRKRIDESFAGNGGERSVVGTADGWVCGHVAASVVPSLHHPLDTSPLGVSVHSFWVGAAPDFRY